MRMELKNALSKEVQFDYWNKKKQIIESQTAIFRHEKDKDKKAIISLYKHDKDISFIADKWKNYTDYLEHVSFVAESNKKIIGHVSIYLIENAITEGEKKLNAWILGPFIVDKEYRNAKEKHDRIKNNYFIGNNLIEFVLKNYCELNEIEKIYIAGTIEDRPFFEHFFYFQEAEKIQAPLWIKPLKVPDDNNNNSIVYKLSHKKIVRLLIYNYLKKKFANMDKEDHPTNKIFSSKEIFSNYYEKLGDNCATDRIIVVIGAGASIEANLLTGDETSDIIQKQIISPDESAIDKLIKEKFDEYFELCKNSEDKSKIKKRISDNLKEFNNKSQAYINESVIEDEINHLTTVFGESPDFESKLQALSKYPAIENKVREILKELMGSRYQPLLSYEILAHLFKQRAIDVIINFNFDELLDQSISDELREDQYIKILSDGDFYDNEEKKFFQKPIYIKPHGTYSHPSTMRFTKNDYFFIPAGIKKAIELSMQENISILFIGFSMKSIEFNSMLKAKILNSLKPKNNDPNNSKIDILECYYLDKVSPDYDTYKTIGLDDKEMREIKQRRSKIPEDGFIAINEYKNGFGYNSVSDFLKYVAKEIRCFFDDNSYGFEISTPKEFIFPSITRHQVVCSLFKDACIDPGEDSDPLGKDSDNNYKESYFYIRCALELLFATASKKGKISLALLNRDRVGSYYRKYIEEYSRKKDHLEPCETLFDIAENLNLEQHSNFYQIDTTIESVEDLAAGFESFIKKIGRKKADNSFYQKVLNNYTKLSVNEKIIKVLSKRYSGPSKEIELYADGVIPLIFQYPAQVYYIRTRLELYNLLYKLIENPEFDRIKIASQNPSWFIKKDNPIYKCLMKLESGKKMDIVIAKNHSDSEEDKSAVTDLEQSPNIEIKTRDWYKHKRFMALFGRNRTANSFDSCAIIYYDQSHHSSYVTPIIAFSDNHTDLSTFEKIFTCYWDKSTPLVSG